MKKFYINKKIINTVIVLIIISLLLALLYVISSRLEKQFDEHSDTTESETNVETPEYILNKNITTVLLMGIDTFGPMTDSESYRNTNQVDFIALVVFNKQNKSCKIIHINRDTMTEIPILGINGKRAGSFNGQLALAYTYGSGLKDSCENVADAVSYLMYNINIDNYVSLTMDAVALLNDYIGGVEVEITDDFSSVDATLVQGKSIILTGSQALIYIRSRQGMDDPTNINRMARQQQYINALYEKMETVLNKDQFVSIELYKKLSDYMITDCGVNEFSEMVSNMSDYTYSGIITLDGESIKGEKYMEFYADEAKLGELALEMFYVKNN